MTLLYFKLKIMINLFFLSMIYYFTVSEVLTTEWMFLPHLYALTIAFNMDYIEKYRKNIHSWHMLLAILGGPLYSIKILFS